MGIFRNFSFLFLCLSILFKASLSEGQHRCLTYERDLAKRAEFKLPTMDSFEKWMSSNRLGSQANFRTQLYPYTLEDPLRIPVIFHIVHEGENIGEGTNISAEQVYSQLEAINIDFHLRASAVEDIPSVFQGVSAEIPIEFVPAIFTPEGDVLNEFGINRHRGNQTNWSFHDIDEVLIPSIIWDTEKYLNIFVIKLNNTDLGYAFYPSDTSLDDIDEVNHVFGSENRDGLVMNYRVLGSNHTSYGDRFNLYPDFDYGHTASHEIGHYFGLHHIWGYSNNSNCEPENDDFCEDTPVQSSSNLNIGTPCEFPGPDRCGNDDLPDMFMNFMDYTLDVCMSMFTLDQKERILTVLENSPRRRTLGYGTPIANLTLSVEENENNQRVISWTDAEPIDQSTLGYIVLRKRTNSEEVRYLSFVDVNEDKIYVDTDHITDAEVYYYQVFAVNENGFSVPSDRYNLVKTLNVGPNPSNGEITLSGDLVCVGKEFHFVLYNLNGQMVYEKAVTPTEETLTVDLSSLRNGVYFLKMVSEESEIKRIVIQ